VARDSEEREAVRGLLSMSMSVMHASPEERGGEWGRIVKKGEERRRKKESGEEK
jgi:hypothetical protein